MVIVKCVCRLRSSKLGLGYACEHAMCSSSSQQSLSSLRITYMDQIWYLIRCYLTAVFVGHVHPNIIGLSHQILQQDFGPA